MMTYTQIQSSTRQRQWEAMQELLKRAQVAPTGLDIGAITQGFLSGDPRLQQVMGNAGLAASPTVKTVTATMPDPAQISSTERARIANLLCTFRDDNVSQRRDTELRRVARNALLDELAKWLEGGAMPYQPKD